MLLQKKKVESDEDDFKGSDMEDDAPAPLRARVGGGRSKAPVKYNFGEDSDEDFD